MGGSDEEKKDNVPHTDDDDSDHAAKPASDRDASSYATEEDEEFVQMGPKCSIREHLEMDKDDESLRRWKEQLLGSVDINPEAQEPDVKVLSLTILSAGRPDIVLQIPESGNPEGLWFTIKEGSKYRLRFAIKVSNEIVCGLKYINYVWKTGIKVDSSKEMLGTFSPQVEPYIHEMPEETTPSGMFARGTYSARTKFIDDDKKCYLDITYTFDIQKEWAETS